MEQKQQWGSRFGYLMVAAGASIGLGNIGNSLIWPIVEEAAYSL